jgi:3-deoxy-7-phosphoheptulonate synthase
VIVVMKPDATADQIDHMEAHIRSLGMSPQVLRGTQRTVIAAIGEEREGLVEALEPGEGVERVLPIMAPYKRASSELTSERTVVSARGLVVGGVKVAVIAGPCSVESEEQIVSIAKVLKGLGATGLRGGAFKPRTSPYSFQGHKEDGLKMLVAARDASGLAIVTEVMAPEHVPMVAKYADVLQIGARNMQNYQLLTSCSASEASVPTRSTHASPFRWQPCPISTKRATSRSSSTPRTGRANHGSSRRWRKPRLPPEPTA